MRKISLLALLAASLGTASAYADTPTFSTFTITSVNDPAFSTITFTVPSMPTPSTVDPGDFIILADVTVDGTVYSNDGLVFYDAPDGGGVSDNYFLNTAGDQLFSGSLSSPDFIDGDFNLTDYSTGTLDYTVNVSSTPEPSSLMLLGTGVLGLAGAARRRFVR